MLVPVCAAKVTLSVTALAVLTGRLERQKLAPFCTTQWEVPAQFESALQGRTHRPDEQVLPEGQSGGAAQFMVK